MYKIIISGLGGQGVLTLSKIISNAFIDKGYHCLLKQEYETSIRNSNIKVNLILSKEKIYSYFIDLADYIILLSKDLNTLYFSNQKTIFFLNNFDIDKKYSYLKLDPINIIKNFGLIFINSYILGTFVKKTNILSNENIKNSFNIVFSNKDFSIINKNYKVYLEGKNQSELSF